LIPTELMVSCPTGLDVGVGAAVGVGVGVSATGGVGVEVDVVGVVCGIAAVGVAVGGVAEAPQPARNAGSKAVSQSDGRRKVVTGAFIALWKRRTQQSVTFCPAVNDPVASTELTLLPGVSHVPWGNGPHGGCQGRRDGRALTRITSLSAVPYDPGSVMAQSEVGFEYKSRLIGEETRKRYPATTYSPTPLPGQYHRRWWA
jgi:hypothetical protein